MPAVDLGSQHAVVPVIERHTASVDEAYPETLANAEPEPLRELDDNPMAPVARVSAPAVDEPARCDVGPCRLAARCECSLITLHYRVSFFLEHSITSLSARPLTSAQLIY